MGKKRKSEIDNPVEILGGLKIEFVELPRRPYRVITLDLTGDLPAELPDIEEVKGAVIKIVVRYHAGAEEEVERLLRRTLDRIRPLAHFVRPPEKQVVRARVKRMEEIKHGQDPLDALEIWLKRRPPPKGIEPDEVRKKLGQFLDSCPAPEERKFPFSVALRAALVHNWMPFQGTFEVAPIPDGLIGVFAKYTDQEFRSNRGGKSAFLESILFSSSGKGRDLQGAEMYIFGEEEKASVGMAWEINEEPFLINREIELSGRGGTRSSVEINSTQYKVEEANKMITGSFGMGRDDFLQTCFVQQGDLQTILSRKSGELKSDIIRWRGLQLWDSLEAKVGGSLNAARAEHKVALEALEVDREIVHEGRPDPDEIHQLKADIRLAEEYVAKMKAASDRVSELQNLLKTAKRVAEARELTETKSEVEKSLTVLQQDLAKAEKKKDQCLEKRKLLESECEGLREILRGEFDGVCPLDEGECPRKDEINAGGDEIRTKLEGVENKAKKAFDQLHEANKDLRECGQQTRTAEMSLDRIRNAEGYVEENSELLSVREYEQQLTATERIEDRGVDIDGMRDQLAEKMASVRRYAEAVDDVEKRTREVLELEEKIRLLQYLRHLCGKKGIPSMMIRDALVDIEAAVNNILDDLGCDHRLEFRYERELKYPAKTCFECGSVFPESAKVKYCKDCGAVRERERTDDLSPMVREGNRVQTFAQDSGAGRSLIALAVRVAMSQFLGARVLFLDEVCSDLDEYHLPIMIRLMHKLPEMGFRQVFVISHQREIAEALPQSIWITRFQNESRSEVQLGSGVYVSIPAKAGSKNG